MKKDVGTKNSSTKNSSTKSSSIKKRLKVNPDGTVTYRMKAGKDTVVASMPYAKALLLEKDDRFQFEYVDGDLADNSADNSADTITEEKEGVQVDNKEMIIAAANSPKKGRGGTKNFPSAKMEVVTNEDKLLVSTLLTEVITEYKQEKVRDDIELAERINDYFLRCAQRGQVPTVEEMSMSTGYSQSTVWDWETGRRPGFSLATAEIIKKAKDVLKTFDAKLVISGKLNFLAYCFRAKNYYGMVDKTEVVLTPNKPLGEEKTPEEIIKSLPEDQKF